MRLAKILVEGYHQDKKPSKESNESKDSKNSTLQKGSELVDEGKTREEKKLSRKEV